jgi:hypothetical protein
MTAPTKPAPNGRTLKQAPAETGITAELGRTGLRYWGGRIDEELLTELKGDQARKVYKEMGDNDPTIGALFNAITWLCRVVEWRVEGETETDERTDLVESCMYDMSHSWEDLVSEIVRGTLQYGWQWHEIVYKRRVPGKSQEPDGQIGWKKLPVRAQDTLQEWRFDPEGSVETFVQRPPPDYRERAIPITKSLLFRTESIKNSPEGKSILRNAYRPWYFKRAIENVEGIGIERDLAGLPVLFAPARLFLSTATSEEQAIKAELEKIVTRIKRDEQEGVLLPQLYDDQGHPLYDLKLLSTGGQRQFDTTAIINRYDLRILQLCLADFIQLGHEKVGSFALASSKTNLFAVAIGVFLDQIQSVFNRFAIPRLLEVNGLELEDPPQLMHGDIEQRELLELADYLNKLAATGMPLFPQPKLEAKLLELAKLPVPTPEEQAVRDLEVEADQLAQQEVMRNASQSQNTGAEQSGPAAPAPAEKRDLEFSLERMLAGEKSAAAGNVRPLADVFDELRARHMVIKTEPNITVNVPPGQPPYIVEVPGPVAQPHITVEAPEPQHITIQPTAVPPAQVTVEGAHVEVSPVVVPAPAVTVENRVEAAAPVVVPAPIVHAPVTVEAAAAPNVDVHVAAPEFPAPVVKVDLPQVTVNLDVQPLVDAIGEASDKLKRPDKLTVERNPDGSVRELKAE